LQVRIKRALVLIAGWAFILLGIAGLFLPVLQGILFLLMKLKQRFPKIATQFDLAKNKAEQKMGRWSRKEKKAAGG
jgi:uncharacterized membrane protein YbaN (DUF454 family)